MVTSIATTPARSVGSARDASKKTPPLSNRNSSSSGERAQIGTGYEQDLVCECLVDRVPKVRRGVDRQEQRRAGPADIGRRPTEPLLP